MRAELYLVVVTCRDLAIGGWYRKPTKSAKLRLVRAYTYVFYCLVQSRLNKFILKLNRSHAIMAYKHVFDFDYCSNGDYSNLDYYV